MNVNCPGCNFGYKLDERRVPDNGQKMRCPKCSTSFRVNKTGVIPSSDGPSPFKGTIQRMPLALDEPSMPNQFTASPGVDLDDPFGDVPPSASTDADDSWGNSPNNPQTTTATPSDDPFAERTSFSIEDPFGRASANKPSTMPSSAAPDDPFGGVTFSASFDGADLPTPVENEDLPGIKADVDLPGIPDAIDLPATLDHMDLPTPLDSIDLSNPEENTDLPSPIGYSDLPSPIGYSDLPSPIEHSDLPSPIGYSDLPSPVGHSDLPSPIEHSNFQSPIDDIEFASPASAPVRDSLDPFGDIELPQSDPPLTQQSRDSLSNMLAAPDDSVSNIDTEDFDLPINGGNPFEEGDMADDPFGGTPLPSSPPEPNKTLIGPGSRPNQAPPSPIFDEDFDIPSPADVSSISPPPTDSFDAEIPMAPSEDPLSDFGNIDLNAASDQLYSPAQTTGPKEISGAGSTDFGQIDFATDQGNNSGEFDAFPVQEEDDDEDQNVPAPQHGGSDSIELADTPLRPMLSDDSFGGLPADAREGSSPQELVTSKKVASEFEGRRKYDRQSRKTNIVLMIVLLLIISGGVSLHFTSYGLFGANFLVSLLPNATADEIVSANFTKTAKSLEKDTFKDMHSAILELNIARKELPKDEDLRLIGVYIHTWHQLRFGISNAHEKEALALLGNIKLDTSKSPYANIVKASRGILTDKNKVVISRLSAKPKLTSNEAALLTLAYLRSNSTQLALETAQKAHKEHPSPRFAYLEALIFLRANQTIDAKSTLESMIETSPTHYDAKLQLAKLLVEQKERDSRKVTALLNPINDASDTQASSEQKALVHSIVGHMLLQRRKYDEAKDEFFKAKSLNANDILMSTGNGKLALMAGDIAGAVTSFRAALVEDPSDITAKLGMADTLIRQDKIQDAQSIIEPLVQSHSNNPKVYYLLGTIALSIKQYEKAMPNLEKAIELDKEFIEAYVAKATVFMETEKTDEAMKTLDAAAASVPKSALIKLTLADGHAKNEDYSSAIVNLDEALEIEPQNPVIHFKMAQMYRKMEELEDAQNALDEVSSIDSNYPGLSVEQGFLMELSGKIDDALETYEAALKINPDDINVKTRVAAASIYQKKYDRAKELLVEVLNENPDSADGNFYMGEIFRIEKSGADAIPYFKTAVEIDANNPLYRVRYGSALAMIHDVGKASKQYDKALELDPKMAETYLKIGELKLRSGAVKSAIEQFEKSLSLNPQIEGAHILIGEAFEELADLKSASGQYLKATQAFPENPTGFFKLGVTYLQTKGNRGAIAPLKTAIRLGQEQEFQPFWLPEAYYHLGSAQKATGDKRGAIASLKKYLIIAPEDAIDRSEVKASLDDLLY